MSNHYHLVLHVNEIDNNQLSHEAICAGWCQLYSKPVLIQRRESKQTISEAEDKKALNIIEGWRGCLADVSLFMRCLNEFIARKVNKEDECSGRLYSLPSMVLTLRDS